MSNSSAGIPIRKQDQISDTTGKGKVSTLENLFKVLAEVVHGQEQDLNDEIAKLNTSSNGIDQGMLLKVQGLVQVWSVTSGLATGAIRAAGDALVKVTQNIR